MRRRSRAEVIAAMTVADRIAMARSKADALTDRCLELERAHANNRFLIYDGVFGNSLDRTFAGNAFAALRNASFGFELIRLTAIWDKPAEDRISIPEIVALIDDVAVRVQLRAEFDGFYSDDENWILRGQWNDRRFERRWRHAIEGTRKVIASTHLTSLRAHRDKFLAHNLTVPTTVSARYGYERRLLRTSQRIAKSLSTVLEDRGLDYEASQELNRRHASEFWTGLSWSLHPR